MNYSKLSFSVLFLLGDVPQKKNAFKYKATVVMKRKYFVIPGMNILRTLDYFWKMTQKN